MIHTAKLIAGNWKMNGLKSSLAEFEAMTPRRSQHSPGQEVPEEHWAYRFAKKHWFFGFGAYS